MTREVRFIAGGNRSPRLRLNDQRFDAIETGTADRVCLRFPTHESGTGGKKESRCGKK